MAPQFRWFWMVGVTVMLVAAAGCTRAAENSGVAGHLNVLKAPTGGGTLATTNAGHTALAVGEDDGPSAQVVLAATRSGSLPSFFALLPELARGPAPSFVKPGLRVTYYQASATVAGSGKDWRPDEKGDFVSPDGQRWSGSGKAGGSGQGYGQFDVVASENGRAIVSLSMFLIPGMSGAPTLSAVSAMPIAPSGPSEFWVSPAALRKLHDRATSILKISHMSYKLGNKSRPAVWIQDGGQAGYSLHVYDAETGVLLHHGSSHQGRISPVIGPDEPSNTASVTLTEGTLVEQRVLDIPWAADSVPDAIKGIQALSYQGAIATAIPGSPVFPIRTSLHLQAKARGRDWIDFSVESSIAGPAPSMPTRGEQVSGRAQLAGYWIPPVGLARLKPGQVLDRDPVTGVVTSVAGTQNGLVVIKQTGPTQQYAYGYNLHSGILSRYQRVDRTGNVTMQTQLQLQGSR